MSAAARSRKIEAAGGAVVRSVEGIWQIIAVHRPRYDDWSLPKGKLEPGESHRDGALREVEEETGLRCRALEELDPVVYRDHRGRRKRVRYWRMTPVGGDSARRPPDAEVDVVRWLDETSAARLLTYRRDLEVAARAIALAAENVTEDGG